MPSSWMLCCVAHKNRWMLFHDRTQGGGGGKVRYLSALTECLWVVLRLVDLLMCDFPTYGTTVAAGNVFWLGRLFRLQEVRCQPVGCRNGFSKMAGVGRSVELRVVLQLARDLEKQRHVVGALF
jgi:hypothetical protein